MWIVDALKSNLKPLSGANTVPLGSNPSQFNRAVFQRLGSKAQQHPDSTENSSTIRKSVFQPLSFPRRSVFQHLNFEFQRNLRSGSSSQQAALKVGGKCPSTNRPNTVAARKRFCVRCLSPNHTRNMRQSSIKCWHCKKWGHVLNSCSLFHDLQYSTRSTKPTGNSNPSSAASPTNWSAGPWCKWFRNHPETTGPLGSDTAHEPPRFTYPLPRAPWKMRRRSFFVELSSPLPYRKPQPFYCSLATAGRSSILLRRNGVPEHRPYAYDAPWLLPRTREWAPKVCKCHHGKSKAGQQGPPHRHCLQPSPGFVSVC